MITEREAVLRVEPKQLDTLLHPQFDAEALKKADAIGKGLAASPGSACGQIVFSAEEAEEAVRNKTMPKVVLVRLETSPEDIVGMQVSQGILTVRGGMTSHAAVVARGMGTCCVSGCGDIKMDEENKKFELAGKTYHEGDFISIDGSTGNIYDGIIPTVDATIGGEFGRVMAWADKYRRLGVRTNADNPHDTEQAVKLQVRDAVLAYLGPQLQGVTDIDAAQQLIAGDLDGIARAAQAAAGERPVRVTLGPEHYPTRDYGTFALPAGVYTSLRVTLGAGAGHNWWCVIFPSLCVPATTDGFADAAAAGGFSDAEIGLMTRANGAYTVKFRSLELLQALKKYLFGE